MKMIFFVRFSRKKNCGELKKTKTKTNQKTIHFALDRPWYGTKQTQKILLKL